MPMLEIIPVANIRPAQMYPHTAALSARPGERSRNLPCNARTSGISAAPNRRKITRYQTNKVVWWPVTNATASAGSRPAVKSAKVVTARAIPSRNVAAATRAATPPARPARPAGRVEPAASAGGAVEVVVVVVVVEVSVDTMSPFDAATIATTRGEAHHPVIDLTRVRFGCGVGSTGCRTPRRPTSSRPS